MDIGKTNEQIKGWFGVACLLLPIVKVGLTLLGVALPIDEILDAICLGAGTVGLPLLARSQPLSIEKKA